MHTTMTTSLNKTAFAEPTPLTRKREANNQAASGKSRLTTVQHRRAVTKRVMVSAIVRSVVVMHWTRDVVDTRSSSRSLHVSASFSGAQVRARHQNSQGPTRAVKNTMGRSENGAKRQVDVIAYLSSLLFDPSLHVPSLRHDGASKNTNDATAEFTRVSVSRTQM